MIQSHHRGLIFDLDGTLADSMPAHWVAWHRTLKRYQLDHLMPHERFLSWGGRPAIVILRQLAEEAGIELDAAAVAMEKRQAYLDAMVGTIKPIPVTVELARSQRGKLKMAIATGSGRLPAERTIEAAGLAGWFDAVVTAEDVEHPKPHPETFLKAAQAIGVAPEHCLAFEDAEPGLIAARDAGMDVIDVRELLTESASA